jgi:5-formyltetrahydrofolate cyclo-ligase
MTDAKRLLRRERLAARHAVPAEVRRARDVAIAAALADLPELAAARGLLLYAALPGEPDLTALLEDPPPGAVLHLPRVEGDAVVAVPHRPGAVLPAGALGVREPVGTAAPDAAIDVVVLPGVAFDADGWRLGRGGGHYDRLLARLGERVVAIGVADEEAVVAEVPRESHDRPVDVLVTDASVRRRAGGAAAGRA